MEAGAGRSAGKAGARRPRKGVPARKWAIAMAAVLGDVLAAIATAGPAPAPAPDAAAIGQLVEAASLDAMAEASTRACLEMGAPNGAALETAYADWRTRHRLALSRSVVMSLAARQHRDLPWKDVSTAMRDRVLGEARPEAACEALMRDWASPTMDATALYPAAEPTARALIQAQVAHAPSPVPTVGALPGGGQVLSVAQLLGLIEPLQRAGAPRAGIPVLVKGRVRRWLDDRVSFQLVQDEGAFQAQRPLKLRFDAEPLLGREVVLRATLKDPRDYVLELDDAVWVSDPTGLQASSQPAQALRRKGVPLQRVLAKPGQGLPEKDFAGVVLHGYADYSNGSQWREDVRYLLRDGSAYSRTEMPPDQLDAARSRRLEPQLWLRWRAAGDRYEFQAQNDQGAPEGTWEAGQHRLMRPWAAGSRLEGYFSRSAFYGSLFTGGTSSTRSIRFQKDGRFERSFHSLSGSGSLAAVQGTAIYGSASGDGKGSQSVAGGTVGTGLGSVTTTTAPHRKDDGASRRGSYTLSGYVAVLRYDDGHEERLLSFPVRDGSVFLGDASYTLDK